MFPETPVLRVCLPNVSQFCHTESIVSSVNLVSKKQTLLLLHGRNISCFHAAWKLGKTRKQLWKHVSSFYQALNLTADGKREQIGKPICVRVLP